MSRKIDWYLIRILGEYEYVSFYVVTLFWSERQRGRERALWKAKEEGERESQANSVLSTEPEVGPDLRNLRSWPEPKSRVRHLDWATQVPQGLWGKFFFFLKIVFIYLTERETASERGNTSRGSGRGRSRLIAEEPDAGLDPRTLGSHPEPKADA